jgi:hypothetical protein
MDNDTGSEKTAPLLTREEIRVLGCLIEKSYTTPDYYPMTLNALLNACNQKSSRSPIVEYGEDTVERAIDTLRDKGWATLVHTAGARTRKFKHEARHEFQFTDGELAILCVLMLRGAQTVGELRSRTERIARFESLGEVEEAVRELAKGYPREFVRELPRSAGQKDSRFIHLLCSELDDQPPMEPVRTTKTSENSSDLGQRVDHLESELRNIQEELDVLRKTVAEFRSQFE